MAFYCKPPAGEVPFEMVRLATFVRLRFLHEVVECRHRLDEFRTLLCQPFFVHNANFLMEGTNLDCMSYFLLSLLTAGDRQISNFIQNAERQLFEFRLRLNSCSELRNSLKKLAHFVLKHDRKWSYSNSTSIDDETVRIFSCLNEFGFGKFVEFVKNSSNFDSTIRLPFTCVLPLVAERNVNLHKGFVDLPQKHASLVMIYIFDKILTRNSSNLCKLRTNLICQDRRLCKLAEDLQGLIRMPTNHKTEFECEYGLTAENVDNHVRRFPPCMLNVHKQLRIKHRLKHHARIQYTLFLKDLGMPLKEAVKFWTNEYSQKASVCGNHEWNHDCKRYVYNLRHLYGLEGAKISYSGHCCRSLQNKIVSFGDDGGCPFRHFDETNLRIFLAKEYGLLDAQVWNKVKKFIEEKSYCKACESVSSSSVHVEKTQFLSQPTHRNDQPMTKFVSRTYASQPTSLGVKELFPQTLCYEHEFCLGESATNRAIIKKPSDFYKIVKM